MSNFPDSHHQMPFGFIDFPSLLPLPPTVSLHPPVIHNFPTPHDFRARSNYSSFWCLKNSNTPGCFSWSSPENQSHRWRNKNCFYLFLLADGANATVFTKCRANRIRNFIWFISTPKKINGGGGGGSVTIAVYEAPVTGLVLILFIGRKLSEHM